MKFFCMFCLFCHSHEALFCLWIQRSHGAAEPFVTCEIVLRLREDPESFTAACNLPAELPPPQGLFAADFQSKLSSWVHHFYTKNVTDQGDVFWFQSLNSTGLEWRMFSNDMECMPHAIAFAQHAVVFAAVITYHLSLTDWSGCYTCTGVQDLSFHWMRNSCVTRLQFCGSDARHSTKLLRHLRWCTSFSRTGSAREMLGVFHSFPFLFSFEQDKRAYRRVLESQDFFIQPLQFRIPLLCPGRHGKKLKSCMCCPQLRSSIRTSDELTENP